MTSSKRRITVRCLVTSVVLCALVPLMGCGGANNNTDTSSSPTPSPAGPSREGDVVVSSGEFRLHWRQLDGDNYEYYLDRAPSFVRVLQPKVKARERELEQGTWLIVTFAEWSQYDLAALPDAVAAVKGFDNILLGLRPFYDWSEIEAWLPEYEQNYATPLWVIMRDGKVVAQHHGIMSKAEISRFVEEALASQAQQAES